MRARSPRLDFIRMRSTPGPRAKRCRGSSKSSRTVASSPERATSASESCFLRMFCEECFRPTDEWTYIHDTGTIETFSVSYLDTDAKRIAEPILVGVVSLDGASPRMGMMHYFGEMTKDDIRIGMRVKAEWKPAAERRGSVLDVRYFRPLREGER